MNGVVYCRVSSKEQVEGTSLESQELACREFARAKSIHILKIFIEQGESAKFADRTQLLELIDFCRHPKGQVQVLLVWKIDRFARNVEDHYTIKATLAKYGVRIVSVTEPIDPDPNGKLLETILAGFAQFDNDIRAMRTVQGMRRKLQEGFFPWKPPLGYVSSTTNGEKKTEPDRPDQPLFGLLQRAWQEFATGAYSKAEMRRLMTSWGVVTHRGQPIPPQSVDSLFASPYYAGILVDPWSKEEYEARHVPMVSRDDFALVQEMLGRSRQRVPHHRIRPEFPLRGMVRCRQCRQYLTGSFSRGRSQRYPYYHCNHRACGYGRKSYPVQQIHTEFEEFLETVQINPELLKPLGQVMLQVAAERQGLMKIKKARVEAELTRITRESQELIRMRAQDLITDQEFLAQKKILWNRRMALEGRVSDDSALPRELVQAQLAAILQPLSHLHETWRLLPEPLRGRFVRLLLPVGFVHGEIRTAELGFLFRVTEAFQGGESNGVDLTGIEPVTS